MYMDSDKHLKYNGQHVAKVAMLLIANITLQCVWMDALTGVYLEYIYIQKRTLNVMRGGGLGSSSKKMYGERLGDGVEYHLMSPTPRR